MFEKELYEVVRGAVSKDVVRLLDTEFDIVQKMMHFMSQVPTSEENHFSDDLVKNSFSLYSPMCFEALSQILLPRIEKIVGKKLYQTFTYARTYHTGAVLKPHRDRASCEYSVTLSISIDKKFGPWTISLQDLRGVHRHVSLQPGDMIVYKGDRIAHWREEYKGRRQTQAFLHYVDQQGPYKEHMFDGRPVLGIPQGIRLKET